MTTTPACRPPQFITDGGIETHIIFNMAQSAADRRLLRHRSLPYRRDLCPLPQLTAFA